MGRKLVMTSRHYDVLRTIKRLQPCSCPQVARILDLDVDAVSKMIFHTFYKAGWIDTETIKIVKCRRKPGTIRLTEEGEQLLNGRLSEKSP